MEFFKYVKQEIAVIKDRDPAIKSTMEVFLYPSFHAILKYRKALLPCTPHFAENGKKDRYRDSSGRPDW